MNKEVILLVADTENNVPQENEEIKEYVTEVWGCGYGEVGGNKVNIFNDIDKMFDDIVSKYGKFYDIKIYFHNLAWDGMLILDNLCRNHGFTRGSGYKVKNKEFITMISDKGQWYKMIFKWKKYTIELVDSLKILPFSVDAIAKGFDTNHKKLKGEIDYTLTRYKGWDITEEEKSYIENDIFVIMEALEKVRDYGLLDHLTIGSACLDFYKQMMGKTFKILFPVLDEELDSEIRKSYRGGWCYVNPKFEDKIIEGVDGYTFDVNSLYPYSMHGKTLEGDDKHIYPVGLPIARIQNDDDLEKYYDKCFFVKLRTHFKIKNGYLPFIQIKKSMFKENEYITDSKTVVEITLTKPDFELFMEHYYVDYMEIVDGWVFEGTVGIFDKYIDYWFEKKAEATRTGNKTLRQLSKLFLNNLYGKFSSRLTADSKVAYFEDGKVKWQIDYDTKNGVYIPAGAYCTAYARCKTVKAAQANYDVFCYADTDSIHCVGEAIGLQIDPVMLGAWANESRWDSARFVRQKTYVERVVIEDGEECEPYWNLKAAGCPDECKNNIVALYGDDLLNGFTYGLCVGGKLSRKTVQGGCILVKTTFRIIK